MLRRAHRLRPLAVVLALAAGCAETQIAGPVTPPGPRTSPDDGDLWNLAPESADVLAEVDLATLRSSPWSRALTESSLSGQREENLRLYGFDLFADGDRLLAVGSEAGGDTTHTLTIVRGRFDPARVAAAFGASTAGVVPNRWRDSPLWEGQGRAVALVTPRTLVAGESGAVRGAIDAAWGIIPDARTGPLGQLRRAMNADQGGPAAFAALTVTDGTRARAAGVIDLPAGLINAAVRLDLGDDLNLELLAGLDSPIDAMAAAAAGNVALQTYSQQQIIRLLGLRPILQAVVLGAEGARVHGHLRVPAESRESLSEKLLSVLQMVAGARHESHDK